MKSLMLLVQSVLVDMSTLCRVSTTRDLNTITSRVVDEGLEFLTITLPLFCKDLERALAEGEVVPSSFRNFKKLGKLPVLFGEFLDLIFDRVDGRLLDDPSIEAIRSLRQFTLMWAKIEIDCTEERVQTAFDQYIQCEHEVMDMTVSLMEERAQSDLLGDQSDRLSQFGHTSHILWADLFQRLEEDVYYGRLIPRHGPGSTADGLSGNGKFRQTSWNTRLEMYFPCGEYLFPSFSYYEELQMIHFDEPEDELPVRVIDVPKSQAKPRIIAMEPTRMMFVQQALMERFFEYIEHPRDNRMAGVIGFTDQTPNQRMAQEGSLTGELATLDLSEASDRVANLLVKEMLKFAPILSEAVQACRTTRADVQGEIYSLSKFASMGSALCFPMEALVFTTIAYMAISKDLKRHLTSKDFKVLRRQVRVYGDDIIVPAIHAPSVAYWLEAFGLKVNERKSFWTGEFRESCGAEYFRGEDVTVVRVRQMPPQSLTDVVETQSWVSMRNQFYKAGYWHTARFLDGWLNEHLGGHFPTVSGRLTDVLSEDPRLANQDSSQVLGRFSFLGYEVEKLSQKTHSPLVRGYVVRPTIPRDHLDGIGALLKFFLKRGDLPIADKKHLERSGRPKAVSMNLRWVCPF